VSSRAMKQSGQPIDIFIGEVGAPSVLGSVDPIMSTGAAIIAAEPDIDIM